jgi:hypothetical protein
MSVELEVLTLIGRRFEQLSVPYMLTGSMALAYYATPRMTRDLDIVIDIAPVTTATLVAGVASDFYVDADVAREAIASARMFNIVHFASGIKVDLIVRKATEYRALEFQRRRPIQLGEDRVWVVSREDLILSKLVWSVDSRSELQRRDVQSLLMAEIDTEYLRHWAATLGVEAALLELMP